MKSSINGIVVILCLVAVECFVAPDVTQHRDYTSYWEERERLLKEDADLRIGHDIVLTAEENIVNNILMAAKTAEFEEDFQSATFPPAINFLISKPEIDNSDVYNILKHMPKGSVLHIHDSTMVSIDWVVSELTYWDDLYMCYTDNNQLLTKFFNIPDKSCNWTLVAEERSSFDNDEDFDDELRRHFTLRYNDNYVKNINNVWSSFENTLIALDGLFTYKDAWFQYLQRGLMELSNDNVLYLEFRGTLPLLYEKDGTQHDLFETMNVYQDAINDFIIQNPNKLYSAKFIYAPLRRVATSTVWKYVKNVIDLKKKFPKLVAGFDLVGQEDLGFPLKNFVEPLTYVVGAGIPLFLHAAETNWEGMPTDENLVDALLLNTTRLGHAYALTKHPKLRQIVKDRDIAIEVNPISNQVLMLVSDLRNHPATSLVAEDFPIVISSDDPAPWNADPLTHDFYMAFMALGGANADLRYLKKLALNSIKYSSLDPDEKSELESMWQIKWNEFIITINKLYIKNQKKQHSHKCDNKLYRGIVI